MPIKIISDDEKNPSSLDNPSNDKRKMNIYYNEAIEEFVNSGVQSFGSAQTPCFMATPNLTVEGWNQQTTFPAQIKQMIVIE